jgi:HD-GYP domain-containing protein (c-di-GMP phosphodiesterase class II)
MSSDRPSDGPSPAAEAAGAAEAVGLAALVRGRGAPLLDGLSEHLPGAREHADASASYAFIAAAELGFDRERAELVREVARLHEVGRIYAPAELVAKPPEELDDGERAALASHPLAGAELARGAGLPPAACEWIRCSGERFGGGGPAGLAGDAIPLESRLIRAACACDRLLAAPGAGADRGAGALAALAAAGGTELDPLLAGALAAALGRSH